MLHRLNLPDKLVCWLRSLIFSPGVGTIILRDLLNNEEYKSSIPMAA